MIKYSSLKIREQKEHCNPKGPDFSSARSIDFSLAGTQVKFLAPKHRTQYSSSENLIPRGDYAIGIDNSKPFNRGVIEDESWRFIPLCYQSWSFYGPWFVGALAELNMSVSVLTPSSLDHKSSFFNPRAFEFGISQYLEARYGNSICFGRAEWIAPSDWESIEGKSTLCASFDVVPDVATDNPGKLMKCFLLPVGDYQILEFSFGLDQIMSGNLEDKDKKIDRASMELLVHQIIQSLDLDLSKEAILQQERALVGMDDRSLVKDFSPLKFTTADQDVEWEAYQIVQRKLGCSD